MGADGKLSSLRPFICVGIAYFLIAVVYPMTMLKTTGEKGSWSAEGFLWSFIAGLIGAIGALGIILAFKFQGKPVYVMPLVFGLAPIVNTFVTMLMSGTFKQAKPIFYIGIILVAIGAAGVLRFKPSKVKPPVEPAVTMLETQSVDFMISDIRPVSFVQEGDQAPQDPEKNPKKLLDNKAQVQQPSEEAPVAAPQEPRKVNSKLQGMSVNIDESDPSPVGGDLDADGNPAEKWQDNPEGIEAPDENAGGWKDPAKQADEAGADSDTEKSSPNLWLIAACIGVTALCWGAYGPVLHKGQAKMAGSRLRPFLCVGLAYFAIAVLVPLFLMGSFPEPGGWDYQGTGWSLLAGAAGAVGALGIIYAFNFGGKPIFVMPLVFGFAPVINTLTETVSKNLIGQVNPYFIGSLAMVIIGAVMVLIFAPRGPKPQPQPETRDAATT